MPTVRIEHWNNLEHHVRPQSPSTGGFACEEVDDPVDDELGRRFSGVDSGVGGVGGGSLMVLGTHVGREGTSLGCQVHAMACFSFFRQFAVNGVPS